MQEIFGGDLVTIQSWNVPVHKKCSAILRKLKNDIYFPCKKSLEESPDESSLLNEGKIEPNVKLECVSKLFYLGDMLGAGGGVEEAASARVRCSRRYLPS